MTSKTKCVLTWYRNDLRIHDHEPLTKALKTGLPVVGLYCFDPRQFGQTSYGFPKTGALRARFLQESVADLKDRFEAKGGSFCIFYQKPEEAIQELMEKLEVQGIYCHKEIGTEEKEVLQKVKKTAGDIPVHTYFGHTLYHPDELPFEVKDLPSQFTQFRKPIENSSEYRDPLPEPDKITGIETDLPTAIPGLENLGLNEEKTDERALVQFKGGETAGKKRLQEYLFGSGQFDHYKETRNGLQEANDSSKLSPWLANGSLSPRFVMQEVKRFEKEKVKNESTYWFYFELLWRDFFSFVHLKNQARMYAESGITRFPFEWEENEAQRKAWLEGKTGHPFVDANMKELNQTGYMTNRGRQNVASFLAKLLGLDWRIGAEWFESRLLDYDPASNYGNWQYNAGVGNDPRAMRVFNIVKQGHDYDPEGIFIKRWLPELKDLPTKFVHEPFKMSEEEQAEYGLRIGQDYPAPIVDYQQAFERYKHKHQKAKELSKKKNQ